MTQELLNHLAIHFLWARRNNRHHSPDYSIIAIFIVFLWNTLHGLL